MRRVVFRITPLNRLSFPVLLNAWEQKQIDNHFKIIIRDTPLQPDEIFDNDIILFSFMTSQLPYIYEELSIIKNCNRKNILIVGGGPHITGEQELSSALGFDVLFIGAGERSFVQFGNDLILGNPIPNVYNEEVTDADFENHLPVSRYMETLPPLEIMRGCYWKCKYCTTHMHHVQSRSITSIDSYLSLGKQKGMSRVNFISPSSMEYGALKGRQVRIDLIQELLECIKSYSFRFVEYGIFPSEVRPDSVTPEGIALLKKYVSNKHIAIGAQSGSDLRLKELSRGHTVTDIENACIIANAHGFSAQLDFIIGYPDETPEERRITMDFIKRISKNYKVRAHLHYFIPLSGSPYGFRFPSFLSPLEKENLHALKSAGIVIAGWESNEIQVNFYLNWLKEKFPSFYERFH